MISSFSYIFYALFSVCAYTYEYTGNGEVSYDGQSRYTWDAFGRVTSITLDAPTTPRLENLTPTKVRYIYDALGRRIARHYKGATEHPYSAPWPDERIVYSGLRPVEEYTTDGELLRRYVYEPGYNVPCMVLENNATTNLTQYILLYDDRGTVLGVVDGATGEVIEKLYYNSTGIVTSMQPDSVNPTLDDYGLPLRRSKYVRFGFTGMYHEPLTEKYHTHFREYDPVHSIWLSRDPIAELGGMNLSAFCRANPTTFSDPLGLAPYWGRGWNPGNWYRWLYTGSPISPDDVYESALDAAGQGVTGAASILANTFTLGGSDRRGWTNSRQYQGWEYDVSRGLSYIGGVAGVGAAAVAAAPAAASGAAYASSWGSTIMATSSTAATVAKGGAAVLSAYHLYNVATDRDYAGKTISIDAGTGVSSIGYAVNDLYGLGRSGVGWVHGLTQRGNTQSMRPLINGKIQSTGGVTRRFTQQGDKMYYRVYSERKTGQWLTAVPPKNSQWAQEALSLPPWNKATFIQEVLIPDGTLLERSRAIPVLEWNRFRGGAEQFQLLEEIPFQNFGSGRLFP